MTLDSIHGVVELGMSTLVWHVTSFQVVPLASSVKLLNQNIKDEILVDPLPPRHHHHHCHHSSTPIELFLMTKGSLGTPLVTRHCDVDTLLKAPQGQRGRFCQGIF